MAFRENNKEKSKGALINVILSWVSTWQFSCKRKPTKISQRNYRTVKFLVDFICFFVEGDLEESFHSFIFF